jgi:hypothetical protein
MVNLLISQFSAVAHVWGREVGMGALVWLLIPLLAAVVAGLWGSWANRTRKARSDGPELDGYARFRAAMEKSHSGT